MYELVWKWSVDLKGVIGDVVGKKEERREEKFRVIFIARVDVMLRSDVK